MKNSNLKALRKRLPSLNALRTFEAAARHGSFKAAAAELCVSHSAVSHQIKLLEQHLDVELFLRKARAVELSRIGRAYFPILRDAFDRIAEGTELILSNEAQGTLTVQVYSTFAIRWLIPRLPDFRGKHPDVQVRLHTSQWDVDFEHDDVDVCVMIGHPAHRNLHYDPLFSSRIFPVCSPTFLESARLEQPADLARHSILQVYPSERDWWSWLEANEVTNVDPTTGEQYDSYDLAMNTAMQGQGIALGMEPFVTRDLDAGLLVEPFPSRRIYTEGSWYLVCRREKAQTEKISVFRDWLLHEIACDTSMPPMRPEPDADDLHGIAITA